MKPWLVGLAVVLFTTIILWLGISIGTKINRHETAIAIDDIQASLAFNRLLEERKLASLLSRGCVAAAAKEVDIVMDQDTKLLASLYKGKLSPSAIKYIENRDPNLLKTLDTFKSRYGEIWKEPECP
jgi:hypothetical protein